MVRLAFRAGIVMFAFAVCVYGPCFAPQVQAQVSQSNAATISGSVSDAAGKPVVGATVSLSGPKGAVTHTDTHGLFVFLGEPIGTYEITITSSAGTVQREISVLADTNVAITYEPNAGLKTIASVSTNAKFNVTPASITHVDPMQLAMQGQTSWRKVLEQIPGVVQAGLGNGGGTNFTASMPNSPLTPVIVSINGGLPYETATLLDDMPLIGNTGAGFAGGAGGGAGTNLSLYPLNGFSGADVVRGPGAGAPSIVDSIGGSLVLHMAGPVSSNHYGFSLTNDPYGGYLANAQAAVRFGKLSAVMTYGFNNSPGPFTGQGPTYLLPSMIDGQNVTTYVPPCPPSVTCSGARVVVPGYLAPGGTALTYGLNLGLLACCVNFGTPWVSHGGSLALSYAVSPSLLAQVAFSGQRSIAPESNALNTLFFSPPSGYTGAFGSGQYLVQANQFGTLQSGSTASSLVEEKITARLGRGTLKLAALQNRVFGSNVYVESTGTEQLFGAACVATVPGGTGGCPAGYALTIYNGSSHTVTPSTAGSFCYTGNDNRDELISYETPIGNMYAGASYVQAYYDNFVNEGLPIGTIPSGISQTTRESRLFLGGNLGPKTTLDLSMYFVRAGYHVPNPNDPNAGLFFLTGDNVTYTDIGYNFAAPRLGFVWRPTAQVAVRASAGGGFAQPPLSDLIGNNNPNFGGLAPTTYLVTPPNFNLQPEKAFAFDIGTDIRLRNTTLLSFDVFEATLHGQFYSFVTDTGTTFTGIFGPGEVFQRQLINLSTSRYEGISLALNHTVSHGFLWSFAGGLTRGYVVSVPPGFYNSKLGGAPCNFTTGANCANLNVVPGINFNGTYSIGAGGLNGGASVPYAQAHGTMGYSWNSGRSAGLSLTYYGNNNSYFRPPFITLDGNIAYAVTRHVSLAVNFYNITGIYDKSIQLTNPANIAAAPVLAGQPYALVGEQVGPRTVQVTLSTSL